MESVTLEGYLGCLVFIIGTYMKYFHIKLLKKCEYVPNVTFVLFLTSLQPKIEWMKNQMIIGDDPKFRQMNNQGICSLEIRKPGNFDGGVYSCRARNEHGEALITCKLEVKRK